MINQNSKNEPENTEKQLTHTLFLQREDQKVHLPYEQEFSFYDAVKAGNIDLVKKQMLPLTDTKLGQLSQNPIRNLKYHLVITIAFITRFCIEGGMAPETGYTLSDLYIQKVDLCNTKEEIIKMHWNIALEFTEKMRKLRKQPVYSRHVMVTMDYIYDHLQEKIDLTTLCNEIQINKSYLCSLFKKETGMTLGQYIAKRKIEAAEIMLIYSDFSAISIGSYLAFSSHSHFIRAFKKETGMTPLEYQKINYRSHLKTPRNNRK